MDPLPEQIARFIEANIESVDDLEILRLLAADPTREWSPAALAGEVQAQPPTITAHLEALEGRGLLTLTRAAGLSCHYGPRTLELEEKVRHLLELYNERPVTMIHMVYARANSALKTFADAFRIRKEG